MRNKLCYKLIRSLGRIIGHGLKKTADRLFVFFRNAPELSDQFLFCCREHLPKRRGTATSEHKRSIGAVLFKRRNVAEIERIRSQLIVLLCPPTDT